MRRNVNSVTREMRGWRRPVPYSYGMREQHKALTGIGLAMSAAVFWYFWPEQKWMTVGIGIIGFSLIVWGLASWYQLARIQAGDDADLLSAIYFVAFGDWGETRDPVAEPNLIPSVSTAKKQILQRALCGDLPVWGESGSSMSLSRIPPRHWKGLDLDLLQVIHGDGQGLAAKPQNIRFVGRESYTGLRTCKAVVEKLWRKPIWLDGSE